MAKGKLRRVFPGGNTSKGFYSYYDYILPADARRIMVLKGGPGVGKSTFMKTIGEEMLSRGYDVEYHHCSSDNNSIDGIVIPKIKVAMIDGTAPHVVDPKNPGAVDEIIHLGEYWNEKGMRRNKEQILAKNREVGRLFRRAYGYLAQAKILKDEIESYYPDSNSIDFAAFNTESRKLLEEVFAGAEDQYRQGFDRHLFASAITPKGPWNYFDTLFDDLAKRFIISGGTAQLRYGLAARAVQQAVSLGYDTEVFHCALEPEKVEHVIIPALSTAIVTSQEPHEYPGKKSDLFLNLDQFMDSNRLKHHIADLAIAQERFSAAFNRAVNFIFRAKTTHDEMETYYIPNMHFDKINQKREEIFQRILSYAEELQEKSSDTIKSIS